jgi:Na+-driven multidrug efflux pump
MTNDARNDERPLFRQFWLGVLLALGILWGTGIFVTVPLVFRGANDTSFDVFASVFNGLTILPACALAFWHRRVACIWLSVNAAMVAIAMISSIARTREFSLVAMVGAAVSVCVALCLDYMELWRWPTALER